MNQARETSEQNEARLDSASADNRSPGEMIHAARGQRDWSLADLGAETKLFEATLARLEADDYASLSQPVFAVGYYRQCARALELDERPVVDAYYRCAGAASPTPAGEPTGSLGVTPANASLGSDWRLSRLLVIALALTAVVVAAAVVVLPNLSRSGADASASGSAGERAQTAAAADPTEPRSTTGPNPARRAAKAAASADAERREQPDATGTPGAPAAAGDRASRSAGADLIGQTEGGIRVSQLLGDSNSAVARARAERPQASGGPGQQPPQTPAVPPNRLKLTFTQKSWVSVKNADGNRLFAGVFKPGDSRTVNSTPPYKLVLGFAPGVEVTLGGKQVDLPPDQVVAHLTVGARQSG